MVAKPKAHFAWEDPFLLEAQLTDDERMVRDTAREYAQGKLLPRVIAAFREEQTDPAIFPEMGKLGLLGATIQGYGCSGVSYVAYGLIAREVEARPIRTSASSVRSAWRSTRSSVRHGPCTIPRSMAR